MCIRTIPYGYVVESGAKVIVADEATVITEVFERYCSGETFKQIADSLTERAIKFFESNSSWNKNNIARMIDDARYSESQTEKGLDEDLIAQTVDEIVVDENGKITLRIKSGAEIKGDI